MLLEQGGAESAEQARALALSLVEASGMQAINGLIARLCEQWRAGEYTDPRQDALYEAQFRMERAEREAKQAAFE